MFRHVTLIAAIGNQGQIGLNGRLPWSCKEDLARFREVTSGGVVVVGRKTYRRHLEGSDRIVVVQSRAGCLSLPDMRYCWDDGQPALGVAVKTRETPAEIAARFPDMPIFIAGGAEIYRLWLESGAVDALDITRISHDLTLFGVPASDHVFFPVDAGWRMTLPEVC